MKKTPHSTIKRPILDLAPPLPVGRGLDVQLEVHVLGQGGDDEVLPPAAAAVTVLKVIVITRVGNPCPHLVCCGEVLEGGGPQHLAAQVTQLIRK